MKAKGFYFVILGLILTTFTIGCGQGYTRQDIETAYNQGYTDGFNDAIEGSSDTTPTPPSKSSSEPEISPPQKVIKNWEVSNLRYTIIEKNNSWWKFSWQLTLKNNTTSVVDFYIYVNFLDRNGYIIDDDIENPSHFAPKEQRGIKGYTLIDTELAPDVKDIEAILSAHVVD